MIFENRYGLVRLKHPVGDEQTDDQNDDQEGALVEKGTYHDFTISPLPPCCPFQRKRVSAGPVVAQVEKPLTR